MRTWFIVMSFYVNGVQQPEVTRELATKQYASYQGCMFDAAALVRHLPYPGQIHGGYLCMYHNESDAALARTQKVVF